MVHKILRNRRREWCAWRREIAATGNCHERQSGSRLQPVSHVVSVHPAHPIIWEIIDLKKKKRKTLYSAPNDPPVPELLNLLSANCNVALHYLLCCCVMMLKYLKEFWTGFVPAFELSCCCKITSYLAKSKRAL